MSGSDKEITVYLQSGPPDLELTRKKINELKETKGRKIILSHSHEVLTEHQLLLPNSRHWYGLKSKDFGCPCLDITKDITKKQKIVRNFIKEEFSNAIICKICNKRDAYPQKDCRYKKQFKKMIDVSFVLAPFVYASTKSINNYNPQEIVVDNCLLNTKSLPAKGLLEFQLRNLEILKNQLKVTSNNLTLEEINERPDYESFINSLRKPYDRIINNLSLIHI